MRFRCHSENDVDRAEVEAPFSTHPWAFQETLTGAQIARGLHFALRLGVFDALKDGPSTAKETAASCGFGVRATTALLEALATTEFVRLDLEAERYRLTDDGRRLMVSSGKYSFADVLLAGELSMHWTTDLLDFARTGDHRRVAASMTPEQWSIHKRSQWAASYLGRSALALTLPLGARSLLDLGAAHGPLLLEACRAHPDTRAVAVDLVNGIRAAETLLADEPSRDGITLYAADPAAFDLGVGQFDAIISSGVVHHLSRPAAEELVSRCARALRPGGVLSFVDFFASSPPRTGGQHAALLSLLLTMTSEAGPFTIEDVTAWQREAGLSPAPPRALLGGIVHVQTGRRTS